jgi:hypothetical protein
MASPALEASAPATTTTTTTTDALLLDALRLTDEVADAMEALAGHLKMASAAGLRSRQAWGEGERDDTLPVSYLSARLGPSVLPPHLQMRLHVALSRVDRGRLTGAELLYAPKAFDATLRVTLAEEAGAAAATDDDSAAAAAAAGSEASAGGTGLRRRRGAESVAAAHTTAETATTDPRPPSLSSSSSSPLAWFGPTAHPRIAAAQAAAVDAVKAAVAAARARRRLAALLDAGAG